MKILFFIDSLYDGGKERRLLELMKGIKSKTNIEFEIVIMNEKVHYKEIFDFGIKVHFLIRRSKKGLYAFKRFYRICKEFKPDFVHCWDSMTAIIAVPACRLLHISLLNGLVVDTPVKQNIFNKYWLRAQLTFPFSKMVIGNSNAGLRAYKAPKKRSICIYNGMDLNRFINLPDPVTVKDEILGEGNRNTFIIGMVAAFEERKDHRVFIKAALKLSAVYPGMKFILIGNGPLFKEIKESIPGSLLKTIIFLGNRSDVESIVNTFDIGILLTNTDVHGEGISNSIIEYMALGKPVIATRGGGTDELVFDNGNGLLIDAHNDDQLVGKIEMLYHDRELMDKLGSKGKEMVNEKYDFLIMTDQYLAIYQQLYRKRKNQETNLLNQNIIIKT